MYVDRPAPLSIWDIETQGPFSFGGKNHANTDNETTTSVFPFPPSSMLMEKCRPALPGGRRGLTRHVQDGHDNLLIFAQRMP